MNYPLRSNLIFLADFRVIYMNTLSKIALATLISANCAIAVAAEVKPTEASASAAVSQDAPASEVAASEVAASETQAK